MINDSFINPDFHIVRKDRDPSRLFASFSVFKTFNGSNMIRYEERPPYPIINSIPSIRDVMNNINKADVMLYFSMLGIGFCSSLVSTRIVNTLYVKFFVHSIYMHCFNLFGINLMFQCSYFRLTGLLDNGLRWRYREEKLDKYDFTRDFERRTIFKYFRERFE